MSSITQALRQTDNEYSAALGTHKGNGSNLSKDDFLLLLVTQFKYQDPLNPMEDQEFVAQMAQFSSLEQLMNLNTGMEGLTTATNNQQMVNATSYIGKQVSVSGNSIGKTTDGNTGEVSVSSFRYAFGDNVTQGILSVKDSFNNIVYTEDLSGKMAGTTFEFNWNGLNNKGEVAPDGVYTVSLEAFNSSGEAVLSDQVVDAVVTGVVREDDTVYLGLDGGQLMSLAEVRQVSELKVTNTVNPDAPESKTDTDEATSDSEASANTSDNSSDSSEQNTTNINVAVPESAVDKAEESVASTFDNVADSLLDTISAVL